MGSAANYAILNSRLSTLLPFSDEKSPCTATVCDSSKIQNRRKIPLFIAPITLVVKIVIHFIQKSTLFNMKNITPFTQLRNIITHHHQENSAVIRVVLLRHLPLLVVPLPDFPLHCRVAKLHVIPVKVKKCPLASSYPHNYIIFSFQTKKSSRGPRFRERFLWFHLRFFLKCGEINKC